VKLFLRDDIAKAWQGKDAFEQALQQAGEIFRDKEGRRTLRCEIAEKSYFLKVHRGVGWVEICKNLLQGRLPILGARNEVEAIRAFEKIGLKTLTIAASGERGINPALQQSFLLTDELTQIISLEDYCREWLKNPPPTALKYALIKRVAEIAACMHKAGINHRDFYLCHFLLDISSPITAQTIAMANIYVIDLHRAQIRQVVPMRWLIKDLGGLYYSALNIGLTRRDILRFVKIHSNALTGSGLKKQITENSQFWQAVVERAGQIYRRDFGREPASSAWDVRRLFARGLQK
jgi:heptose I phosphotransferase